MTDPLLIWFNPDIQRYEAGLRTDYITSFLSSHNQDRFQILYEFSLETKSVCHKILNALNAVRVSSRLNF